MYTACFLSLLEVVLVPPYLLENAAIHRAEAALDSFCDWAGNRGFHI